MSTETHPITESTRQDRTREASDDDSVLCLTHGFRLWRAEDYGWLVRLGADTTGEVYACIDESDDAFELMELVNGFRWTTHPSLHSAIERFLIGAPLSHDRVSPRAALGPNEVSRASELTRVIDGWLADLHVSPGSGEGRHGAVAE